MKALVAHQFGDMPNMQIKTRNIPDIKPGFSLVKMHAATINQLSNLIRSGVIPQAKPPLVLSNDGSGIVEKSERFTQGTRVAIYGGGQVGITEDGLQQQWVLVEDKHLIELPSDFDLDEGAAIPINYVTAYQALTRVGQVLAGQKILISGASGSVGHALIQTAVALGAIPIAIVSTTKKVERAQCSGAQIVIDLSKQDLLQTVLDVTQGQGADLAFDPVGGPLLGQLLKAIRPRGALVSIGFLGGVTGSFDLPDLVIQEKQILGYDAWMETDADVEHAFKSITQFIKVGHLKPSIDSSYPLEQYDAAYRRLASREATGTILLHL